MARATATAERDDLSLVAAYLEGDAGAFDTLFQRYHARVRSVCLRYVGNDHIAEDLVQETFYNVIRALPRVSDGFNFGAWVHRIAVNICQDELRRRSRRATHVESNGDPDEHMLKLPDRDRSANPQDALEISHMRQLVWEVAKKLPERQRMVLTLRELQGMSYASIAHVMGLSDSAVETLLHRARKRFKEQYLLMETPVEERGPCATVAYYMVSVGRENLTPEQKRVVTQHIAGCEWCEAQYVRPESIELNGRAAVRASSNGH